VHRSGRASGVRRPAVAGTFYPAEPDRLAEMVAGLLATADTLSATVPPEPPDAPAAIVVPHAGYVYSGPVAATVYARLRRVPPRRVALLGPAHYVPLAGMAVPAVSGFATPLGVVPVDVAACLALGADQPAVRVSDTPHQPEHSLEVQLPFLQQLWGDGFEVLPVAVGAASEDMVADLLDAVVSAGPTLVVVSTDLSHYLDRATAERRDRATAEAVVGRNPAAIASRDACGAHALRGLLAWTLRNDLTVDLLDLRTSADTAGDPSRVVGYGAFVVDAAE
jgi:AmmeMemoRadiSam system protein B